MNPLVCVVIVTWNNEKDIKECLESLQSQTYTNFKIIVVDNHSADNTCEIVKGFEDIKLFARQRNYFLAGSNNFAIRYILKNFDSKHILTLSPDTKADNNLIEELVNTIESNAEYGAVGPKVKFYKNPNDGLINSAGVDYDGFDKAEDIGFMQEDSGLYDKVEEVFAVRGTCILYRVEMLKSVGLYWEMINMYLDELELFIRAHAKGWKVVYTPKTTVWHSYMQSTDKNKSFSAEKQKARAWLLIALRHYGFRAKLAMIGKYLDFRISKVVKDPPIVKPDL